MKVGVFSLHSHCQVVGRSVSTSPVADDRSDQIVDLYSVLMNVGVETNAVV